MLLDGPADEFDRKQDAGLVIGEHYRNEQCVVIDQRYKPLDRQAAVNIDLDAADPIAAALE